jgi:hypothetical protein
MPAADGRLMPRHTKPGQGPKLTNRQRPGLLGSQDLDMNLERIWYESSPYLYLIVGLYVLLGMEGPLAKACGLLLLVTSALILQMRWSFRKRENRERLKAASRKTAGVRAR